MKIDADGADGFWKVVDRYKMGNKKRETGLDVDKEMEEEGGGRGLGDS